MRLKFRVSAALVAWAMVPAAAAVAEELTVFIKASPPEPRTVAEEKASQEEIAALRQQQKDLSEALKKQFGKKEESWPADKRAELNALFEKIGSLSFKNRYASKGGATPKDLEDDAKGAESSAKGTREKLDPKKGVRAVTTVEEADLQIEVLGRGIRRNILDAWAAMIWFRVVPGGRLDPALLAKKPVAWPYHGSMMSGSSTAPVHQYSEAEPYWWIESERPTNALVGSGVFGKMESQLGDSLAKLLKEQGAAIAACRKGR